MMTNKQIAKLPVAAEADVLVVGGGPAGVAAAFAAARSGAKTLIVEQFNCLGGVATAGGHGHICLYSAWADTTRVVGGIPYEMAVRVSKAGYGAHNTSCVDFEVEGMKLVLEQMAEECGCQLLYHTFFCDTVVERKRVTGAVIQNKGGRQVILAKRTVDCTGDGDVAARAGCAYEQGEEGTGLCQPVTLMFTIGGVDIKAFSAFQQVEGYTMAGVWKRAQDKGDMRPFQSRIMGWWWTPTRPDQLGVNFTHVTGIDTTRAADLTAATIEARKQAYESIAVFRKYVGGLENCHMVSTPATLGTRESRRITGRYVLTKEDVLEMRNFKDSIGYGSFFIDIHNCRGIGMDAKTVNPAPGLKYQIPYRLLVPQGIDNLLVAGRCVSCTHEALGSLRVMPQCGVMGEAAGTAAALSLKEDVPPRRLKAAGLQAALKRQGVIVDERDIEAARQQDAALARSIK